MDHPHCIIIYTPGDGNAHMVGAQRARLDKAWLYSKWVIIPESDLDGFLAERLGDGFIVVDQRAKADQINPGMSAATPIVAVMKEFDLMLAADAMMILHRAILEAQND